VPYEGGEPGAGGGYDCVGLVAFAEEYEALAVSKFHTVIVVASAGEGGLLPAVLCHVGTFHI